MTSLGRWRLSTTAALTLVSLGCSSLGCSGPAPGRDAGEPDTGPPMDAQTVDASFGCQSDEDCEDNISCTADSCGPDHVCRNAVIPTACDDGVFCNGVERCDLAVGCVPAEMRETCNDDDVCTIDRCDEEADTCRHYPRDLDEDGDPDWFCEGGGDCDDTNPALSSLVAEVCDDRIDNDCDEIVDEPMCGRPRYDLCDDPLDVSTGGFFVVNTSGATFDYAVGCLPGAMRRDLVASFTLTEPRSVSIEGEADLSSVALSLRTTCDAAASELACETGFPGTIRRRSLPAGEYFVVISANTPGEISLNVDFDDPIPPFTNDTCETALDIGTGGAFTETFVEVADDESPRCGFSGSPDLVYTFTTTTEQDVRVTAQSATSDSMDWAIRSTCSDPASELRCVYGAPAAGRVHQLPAGTYFLIVEGPSYADVDFTLTVDFLPPSPPPPGDLCSDPIVLTAGTTYTGSFIDKQDDLEVSCGFRYRDAVHTFTLPAAADVTLELDGSTFSNMSLRTACADGGSQLICVSGDPARTRLRGLGAGTYYVIAESSRGSGYTLRLDTTTPPAVAMPVTGNENCSSAHVIPETGGLFSGNTTSMANDYTTNPLSICGGGSESPDAAFQLTLTARRRVVVSTEGSSFDTVLHAHRETCMSGAELHCEDDLRTGGLTSLMDRVLDPGTWYFIVDGYGTASRGAYVLDAVVTDPP